MLKTFRIISLLEGISFVIILSVTLGLISRDYVYPLGMTHGALFVIYLIFSLALSSKQGWSLLMWFGLFLASLIPLAFIPVEFFLRKKTAEH